MKILKFGRYLIYLLLVTLSLLLIVGVINWFINPYGIYDSPVIEGFNALKHGATKIRKAYAVRSIKPCAVCLGSSKVYVGIDPDHPGWECTPVYNIGLNGTNIYEMTRYLQHANAVQPLKEVVLMLDFENFNVPIKNTPDFDEDRFVITYDGKENWWFNIKDTLATLFSIQALLSSINTPVNQVRADLQNGMDDPTAMRNATNAKFGSLHAAFLEDARNAMKYHFTEKYPLENTNTNWVSFDYYRKILQLAYRENIHLYIGIAPYHVYQWEALRASDYWQRFELWKRMLVAINEEEALRAGKPPFPLWDFAVYNQFTTEALPPLGDTQTKMQWWWEYTHYKKELGDIVLDRIFNYHSSSRVVPDDLGVLLTSKNIDEHLLEIQVDRQQYHDTHPDYIAEIEDLAKQLGKWAEPR